MVGGRILTDRKLPVMTAVTTTGHPGVIKHPGGKTAGDMAHRAILGSGNMVDRLANGGRAIMTGRTIVHDTRVIEHRR
jgi:hypothetical protein